MATLTTIEQIEESGINVTLGGAVGPQGTRGDYPQEPVTIASGPTLTMDASLSAYFRFVATENFVFNPPTNPVDGQRIIVEITQDGVGGHSMSLAAGFNPGSFVLTLSTDPASIDFMGICYHQPTGKWIILSFVRGY